MQERIFFEVYGKKKIFLAPMHSIDVGHMDKSLEYFGEAKAICEEFGLFPLMQFNHVIDEDIVAQFYATIHINKTNEREIVWMTREKPMKATWGQFGECLGYPIVHDPTTDGLFRVHTEPCPMEKKYHAPLLILGWGV
jgi:hypothetical protein